MEVGVTQRKRQEMVAGHVIVSVRVVYTLEVEETNLTTPH